MPLNGLTFLSLGFYDVKSIANAAVYYFHNVKSVAKMVIILLL